jgi:hypothetical protein
MTDEDALAFPFQPRIIRLMRDTCRSCGQKISPSSAWCPWCGERIYQAIAWRPILIIGIAIALLAVLIVFLVLTGNG